MAVLIHISPETAFACARGKVVTAESAGTHDQHVRYVGNREPSLLSNELLRRTNESKADRTDRWPQLCDGDAVTVTRGLIDV